MISWVRRLHVIATAIAGAQLVIWAGTGFAFTLFDFRAVHGDDDRAPAPGLEVPAASAPLGRIVAHARAARPGDAPVTSVELTMLAGRATYLISFASGAPSLVDAADEEVITVDAGVSRRVAERAFARPVSARGVASRDDDGKPVFVVSLDDARSTDVTVDAGTGKVLAWRNSAFRAFDALWSLHVLGYLDRKSPANWPLRLAAFFAVAAVTSGAALLGLRYTRRSRVLAADLELRGPERRQLGA